MEWYTTKNPVMTPTLYLIPSPSSGKSIPMIPNEIKYIMEKLDYFTIENENEAWR